MSADALLLKDGAAMAEAVRSGAVSAVALAQASLDRIDATNGRVNAFTDVVRERALRRAATRTTSRASPAARRAARARRWRRGRSR